MSHVSSLLSTSLFTLTAASTQAASPAPETLSSGVIIQTLTKNTDPSPKVNDMVKVHYRGTLTSDTKFDSFYKRGQPISFPLNRMIPYQTEGIQKMQVNGRAKLTYPTTSARGERGVPGTIPPNSMLNLEVELLSIGGQPKDRQIGLIIAFSRRFAPRQSQRSPKHDRI